jgi:hypothetical protein
VDLAQGDAGDHAMSSQAADIPAAANDAVASGRSASSPAASVHRRLLRLFLIFWVVVAFHLVVLDRRETWPNGPIAIAMCAAPPITPVVQFAWAKFAPGIWFTLLMAPMVVSWIGAARHPASGGWLFAARSSIVGYWMILWFALGAFA